MKPERNITLEVLKLFASYMVVFIHVSFQGDIGIAMDALARFAVPFFFTVSGFYSYRISLKKIKKRAKHIFYLLSIAVFCHTLCKSALFILTHDYSGIILYFREYLQPKELAALFLWNMPVHLDYLWYLLAMLYVYFVFYWITKFHLSEKHVFFIAVSLLVITVMLGEILSLFSISLPIALVRNFLFLGFPCFALGLLLKKHEDRFSVIPGALILSAVVLGVLEPLLSRFLFGRKEIYVGSILLLLAFVCIASRYSDVRYPKAVTALTGCSAYIYIFHIVVSSVMMAGYSMLSIDTAFPIILDIHPFIVCIATTILALVVTKTIHPLIFRK